MKSTQSTTTVKVKNNEKTFELLEVFPFTSDRKRMSVIVKSNGVIKMYSKGVRIYLFRLIVSLRRDWRTTHT